MLKPARGGQVLAELRNPHDARFELFPLQETTLEDEIFKLGFGAAEHCGSSDDGWSERQGVLVENRQVDDL
jgi:hypothetical protein